MRGIGTKSGVQALGDYIFAMGYIQFVCRRASFSHAKKFSLFSIKILDDYYDKQTNPVIICALCSDITHHVYRIVKRVSCFCGSRLQMRKKTTTPKSPQKEAVKHLLGGYEEYMPV
jgi:hypothetical protein